MNCLAWGSFATPDAVCRRAGGRRRWNAVRKVRAAFRRLAVAKLLLRLPAGRGVLAEISRRLGVHRATITRDIRAMQWRLA